jgi:hypothetical protein
MTRLIAIAGAVFATLSATIAHAAAAPEAVIPLERWRTRWTMTADIGGAPRKLLLDTAGGLTLVSPRTVAALGCTPWGRLTGFTMFAQRGDGGRCANVPVAANGYRVTLPAVGGIDLGKLNPADAPLDGIAALNLFDGKAITLDLARGRLTVESAASLAERTATMRPLAIRLSREVQGLALAANAEVPTARGPVWMELDSGNGGTVLISKHIADLFSGLDPAKEGKQAVRFAIQPGVEVATEDAMTPDIILDGNLGMPFLRNWIITLDLRDGRGWIAPAGV